MRTTLDIDQDILDAAKELARSEGKTAGQIISDLARRALTTPVGQGLAESQSKYDGDDWPTFTSRPGPIITPEHIQRVQDEIDLEDATPWDFETNAPRKFDR